MKEKSTLVYGLLVLPLLLFSVSGNAADSTRGKAKAAACAGCHGSNGISVSSEYPNLAGQKEAYLVKQLKAFKRRSRPSPIMQAMAGSLNSADIENLAAYFSGLPHSPATPAKTTVTATDKASATEFPETTFITMKKSGTVETFPDEIIWQGGPNMLYDAVTPDGTKVLATSPSGNNVCVLDTRTGKQLAVIAVGKAPKGVKVSPDGRYAYVSNQGSATISVIDLQKLTVVDSIKVEAAPHNIRFTRDGRLAYVTLQGGAGLGVIDTRQRKMVRVIPLPGITGPHNLDLSPDEKTAYVRDFVHHVAVLDLEHARVRKVITVGNGHGGIDVSPNGRYIATTAIADHYVSLIDPESLKVTRIDVGGGSHGIRASRDSHWIYVTLTKENQVAVINTATLKVEKKIAVGKFPFWIAVQGNP